MDVFEAQTKEIQKHRWLESEKVGHDVGEAWAAEDWVYRFAELFRIAWRKSHALV